jgi:hypothetical protein
LGDVGEARLLGDGKGEIGVGLRVGCFNGGLSPQFYAGLKITSLVSAIFLLFCDGYSFRIAVPMKWSKLLIEALSGDILLLPDFRFRTHSELHN